MNLVVDFLLEYYLWVLVVLVILIITVIGFLVDTKRKKKLREKSDNNLNQSGQTIGQNNMNGMVQNTNMMDPMMNQNMNNLDGFNDAMFNPNPPALDTNMNQGINTFDPMMNQSMNNNLVNNMMGQNNIPIQNEVTSQNNMENMNRVSVQNQTLSNNLVNNNQLEQNTLAQNNMMNQNNNINSSDAFFVPTSQQSPVFESREVVIPKPVEAAPLMGSTPTPVIEPIPVQASAQNTNVMPNSNMNMVNNNVETIPNMVNNSVNQINPTSTAQVNTITPTTVVMPEVSLPQIGVPNNNATFSPAEPVVQNSMPGQIPVMQEVVSSNLNPNLQINSTPPVAPNIVNNQLPNNDFTTFSAQNIQPSTVNPVPTMNIPNNQTVNPTVMGQPINNTQPVGNDNWQL